MKAYKGFNRDMTCRGFQYEEGKEYKEDTAEICKSGFHACEYPLDCFGYYDPAGSVFHEVELGEDAKGGGYDTKLCSKTIKIGARISFAKMVEASVNFILEKCEKKEENTGNRSVASTSGYQSAASTSGLWSVASTSGYQSAASTSGLWSVASTSGSQSAASTSGLWSVASTSGNQSAASTSGDWSAASTSGYRSVASTSGNQSAASTSGNRSVASTSGYRSVASTSGNQSAASTSGYRSVAIVDGKESVAVATGIESKAKGAKGCYIALAEWAEVDGEWHMINFKSRKVDGKRIKADTFYMLKDGKFVEVE